MEKKERKQRKIKQEHILLVTMVQYQNVLRSEQQFAEIATRL